MLEDLNRRKFIQYAALAAGSGSVAHLPAASSEHKHAAQKTAKDFLQHYPASLFTEPQIQLVAAIARQIIPTNDTPGADEANTGLFIELMVQHWFSESERQRFMQDLSELEYVSGAAFDALNSDRQLAILEDLEEAAADAGWFKLGNVARTWDSEAPFICQIKELTVLGFMLSEVGSTQFLRPNPMGDFDGELKLDKNSHSYAVDMPIRVFNKN